MLSRMLFPSMRLITSTITKMMAAMSSMQKKLLAKLRRLMLLLLKENTIRNTKPTMGTANRSESPKYAQGLSGLYWAGRFASVTDILL